MKVRVRWREECTYERVVEIDDDDWEGVHISDRGDLMNDYVDELLTDAICDQADYLKDIVSCDGRGIDEYEALL